MFPLAPPLAHKGTTEQCTIRTGLSVAGVPTRRRQQSRFSATPHRGALSDPSPGLRDALSAEGATTRCRSSAVARRALAGGVVIGMVEAVKAFSSCRPSSGGGSLVPHMLEGSQGSPLGENPSSVIELEGGRSDRPTQELDSSSWKDYQTTQASPRWYPFSSCVE